jgi:hypothetical protein
MNRAAKKIIYGIAWNVLLAAVLVTLYFAFVRQAPSCTDGTLNQGEQGIDCGGPCASCEAKNLVSIRTIRDVEVFRTASGKATLLAAILNPNTGYVAEFSYEFVVLDARGNVLERISGSDTLFASETRYLITGSVETAAQKIGKVTLTIGDPQWKPKREVLRPDVSVLPGARTTIENGTIYARGSVRNQSTASAEGIRVVAFLLDRSGNELFVGQALVSRLSGGSEEPFVVQFPSDASLATRVDVDATRFSVVSR